MPQLKPRMHTAIVPERLANDTVTSATGEATPISGASANGIGSPAICHQRQFTLARDDLWPEPRSHG
jgi:hypothetical protein